MITRLVSITITVGLGGELCSLFPAARTHSGNASTIPGIRELGHAKSLASKSRAPEKQTLVKASKQADPGFGIHFF